MAFDHFDGTGHAVFGTDAFAKSGGTCTQR
jgi:hypothetical protein